MAALRAEVEALKAGMGGGKGVVGNDQPALGPHTKATVV